jgi:excisionase family DNA binding protein
MSHPDAQQGPYMTYSAAQRYTSLSRSTLHKARKEGQLPAIKIGKSVRFHVDDLEEFMRSNLYESR